MALWITRAEPVELRPNASEDDLKVVMQAVYKQVLGNQYLWESDRLKLESAESLLRNGDITVRGFVRTIGQSELYRSLFFENFSQYRFIELNCKHFLGRAPIDQAEISRHVKIYNGLGYEAEIDSYLDSDEYQSGFGEYIVPSPRTETTLESFQNVGFNRTYALYGGFASSDRDKSAKLTRDLASNLPTKITFPAKGSRAYSNTAKRFRIATVRSNSGPRVTQSRTTFEVGYDQMSQKIQNIQRTGGKILSITEVTQ